MSLIVVTMSANRLNISYELVSESVASENVEDEVIIVHFDSGNYFSLRGAASTAWNAIIEGSVAPSSLVPLIDAEESAAEIQVARFINFLVAEQIIRPADGEPKLNTATDRLAVNELIAEKYEDMQLLLLGDPIHEVEAEGWPAMRGGEGQQ